LRPLSQEDADELSQTYTTRGVQVESEFRLIAEGSVVNAAQLDKIQHVDKVARLRQGLSLAAEFPAQAAVPMRSDYSGYKGDTKLCDLHMAHGVPVVSRKLKSAIEKSGGGEGVEFLPIKILDHSGGLASDQYFVLNPKAYECLDEDKSEPRFSGGGTVIRQVKRLVIHPASIPATAKVFRIAKYRDPVVFRKALADTIGAASLSNVAFVQPRR
jgi:hypothetical protein